MKIKWWKEFNSKPVTGCWVNERTVLYVQTWLDIFRFIPYRYPEFYTRIFWQQWPEEDDVSIYF